MVLNVQSFWSFASEGRCLASRTAMLPRLLYTAEYFIAPEKHSCNQRANNEMGGNNTAEVKCAIRKHHCFGCYCGIAVTIYHII